MHTGSALALRESGQDIEASIVSRSISRASNMIFSDFSLSACDTL
jgi:hypothetical protein